MRQYRCVSISARRGRAASQTAPRRLGKRRLLPEWLTRRSVERGAPHSLREKPHRVRLESHGFVRAAAHNDLPDFSCVSLS